MKNTILISVLFCSYTLLQSQNLVSNCDFSKVTSCPTWSGQFDRAKDWLIPGEGTSDLCHSCNNDIVNAPNNMWGYQDPYSGEGYANIISYYPFQGNDYREYIQAELACPLSAGEIYDVSFYVSLSDNSRYAIDGIGLLFSDIPITQSGDNVVDPGFPGHIYNPPGDVISTKTAWIKVSGQYLASGNERYITIGSFIPEDELTIVSLPGTSSTYTSFYIDLVSVSPVTPMALLGHDTTLCYGGSIMLEAPDLCAGTFTWDDGSSDVLRQITQPGIYSITVYLGCSEISDQVTIDWMPEPLVNLPQDTVLCAGSSILLNPGEFQAYLWQNGSAEPTMLVDQAGLFWVEITNEIGCAYRDTVEVKWLDPPAVDLGEDLVLCLGDSIVLEAGNENIYSIYTWQDYSMAPNLVAWQDGTYSVRVSNPCGSDWDDILLRFRNCEPLISVPNAFTPDGDGLNDTFKAQCVNISGFSMQIFSRWGEMIFTTNDPSTGWDGRKNGKDCGTDVYAWVIYYESTTLETPGSGVLQGTFVLIR